MQYQDLAVWLSVDLTAIHLDQLTLWYEGLLRGNGREELAGRDIIVYSYPRVVRLRRLLARRDTSQIRQSTKGKTRGFTLRFAVFV